MSSTHCPAASSGRCTHACGIDSSDFLAEQRNSTYLKRDEIDALPVRAGTGDKAARDELVCRLVPLAFILARQECRGQWRLVDDLDAEAMVVLVETVATWDYSKPTDFFFFEFRYLARASMRAVFLNGTRPLSVPRGVSQVPFSRWKDAVQKKRMPAAALDYLATVPQSPLELEFVQVDPKEIAEVDEADVLADVAAMLSQLSERKREVIERHYGLGGRKPESLSSIASSFGFSKERASQHHRIGLDRLRKAALQAV